MNNILIILPDSFLYITAPWQRLYYHNSHLTLNICKIYKNTLFTYRYITIYCSVLHTKLFTLAFTESWNYLTYQPSFIITIYVAAHQYYLYNCSAWRSYILWLHCSYYYCILSQPISQKHKQYKIKKLVSTPTHLSFIYHSSSRLRERRV